MNEMDHPHLALLRAAVNADPLRGVPPHLLKLHKQQQKAIREQRERAVAEHAEDEEGRRWGPRRLARRSGVR